MKKLLQLFAAVVLTSIIALPALAGDIQIPPVVTPPPPRQSSVMGSGMETQLVVEGASGEATSLSPVAEIGLSVLQSVLALF